MATALALTAVVAGVACDEATPAAAEAGPAGDATQAPDLAAVADGGVPVDVAGEGAGPSPDGASPPAGQVTWLLHLTDLHFGVNDKAQPRLAAALTRLLPALDPAATVVTGDLVDDGTEGPAWKLYEHTVTSAKVPAFPGYLEVAGNHDIKDDGPAAFLSATVTGKAQGGLHGQALFDTAAGRLRLLYTNTVDSDSAVLRLAGAFGQQQLDALLALSPGPAPPSHTVVAGHHSLIGLIKLIGPAEARLKQLLSEREAAVYLCGHVHLTALGWVGSTLVVQGPSLGKNSQSRAMIVALDPAGPAAQEVALDERGEVGWPLVMVTAPADAALGGKNPHAAAVVAPEVTVRALVFAPAGVDAVRARFAGGASGPLTPTANANEWTGSLPVPPATRGAGKRALTVEAISNTGASASDTVTVVVAP